MTWKIEYVILIMISTLISYLCAILMENASKKKRKILLLTSLFINLGILFTFKYYNFFSDVVRNFFSIFLLDLKFYELNFLLPIGISFYTFQTLSYTIDVYNNKIKPEKHLGIFAVYVSFFPQLVAGPIERAKDLLPQFFEKKEFSYQNLISGLKLIIWGFFKKVVIADRLAILVNTVYSNPSDFTGFSLILATVFFAFQIYCDFSAYSDIAVGSAKIMGYNLTTNFKRPYFSKSIQEFWTRWHISLSAWLKDYIYIPLGGNRVSRNRFYFNIFIVFLISGIWHGASWNFIIWGILHGFLMIISNLISKIIPNNKKSILPHPGILNISNIINLIQIAITFTLVCFTWIFFRAESINDAIYIITHLFPLFDGSIFGAPIGLNLDGLIIGIATILFMELVHLVQENKNLKKLFSNKPIFLKMGFYLFLVISILMFGVFEETQFIYFQF